ncbi:syntaxin-5-like [Dysidea avara]|uniref:syntaxin-5-like n=1 Tax=Dysidea avara TaxID=196820 RepID=UPI00332AC2F7
MSCRDRTTEFHSVIRSLQAVQQFRSPPRPSSNPSDVIRAARAIGYNIGQTCAKLEQLTELARGRNIFGDPSSQIQELTAVIKQDLANLNSEIAALQQQVKSRSGRESHHVHTHSSGVVVSLQSKLASISHDFKSILEVRTESLKEQKQRREQFSSNSPFITPMPSAISDGRSVLLESRPDDIAIDMNQISQQNQRQQQLLDEQENYIQERAETMENIESTIVELGVIFKQLAEMVKDQEEQVERIDTNVAEVDLNVQAAHTELLKYFQGITSNRWLMIKIFMVLIVFFIIFVVFLT